MPPAAASGPLVGGSEALRRIAADVSGQLDLEQLFKDVLEHSCALFEAERVGLWLMEKGRHPFRLAAQRGLSANLVQAVSELTADDETLGGRAVRERVPIVVHDARQSTFTGTLHDIYVADGIETACGVPIVFRDEALGVLVLYHDRPHAWPPFELALAISFADQMAVAIQNARLYHSVSTLAGSLQSIQELTARLARLQDPREIVEAIAHEVRELIDAAVVRVYSVEHARGVCEPRAASGELRPYSDVYRALPLRVGQGVVGWVAEHDTPLLTGDVTADPRSYSPGGDDLEISMLVVPLTYGGGVQGVIALTRRGLNRFDGDDLTSMTIFAGFAAQTLANAENNARRLQQRAELEQLLASQRKLLEVNERLQAALDPKDVLDLIADSLKAVVRYDNLSVYQVDRPAGLFRAVLARDRFADEILRSSFPLDGGITGWVFAHSEAQRVNDAHLDRRMRLIPGTPPEPESLAVVPLVVRGEVIGTLNVGRLGGVEAHFSDTEFELVKLFAGQASVAMQNAQLHHEVSTRAETDALTGLRNHGAFQSQLAELSSQHGQAGFGLLMLDLDELKRVNDTFGHPAGDRLLRTAATAIRSAIRDTDSAFRYGGDEFAVLLPGTTLPQASVVAERIRLTVQEAFTHSTAITVSVGVGCFPVDATTKDELLARTDAALYRAKQGGGNHVAAVSGTVGEQAASTAGVAGASGTTAIVASRPAAGSGPPDAVDPASPSGEAGAAVAARRRTRSGGRDAYLDALDETALGLLSQLEPGELLEAIVRRAGSLAGTEDGFVYLAREETDSLELMVGVGVFSPLIGVRLAGGEGLSGRVYRSGSVRNVRDYARWAGRVPGLAAGGDRSPSGPVHATVGLPLTAHGKVIGVLGLSQRDPARLFGRAAIQELSRFAQLASVALANARLYDEARRELARRQRAELALQRSEARFRSIVQSTSDLVVILDADGRFTYASPVIEHLLGVRPEELVGAYLLDRVHVDDRAGVQAAFARLAGTPGSRDTVMVRVRHADGSWRTIDARVNNQLLDPNVAGIVATGRDVTERQGFEEQLARQALYDPLTGLANRALFMDRLSYALGRSDRVAQHVALLLLDLDRFTLVNESLGHPAGDDLLVGVARRLRELVRPGDTVARLGSDEFAVLLGTVRDLAEATRVAEQIAERLETPFVLGTQETYVSASVGIAIGWPGEEDAAGLLREADVALHRAKSNSSTGRAVFDPSMGGIPAKRLELETDLRRAIRQDELLLHYQPVVDLADGRVVGVEALVRWQHPRRGLLTPDAFVALAEETGLILPLGRRVLERACSQARAWQDASPGVTPLRMNVNLSTLQVAHPDLPATVQRILRTTGLDPACLGLEITESALIAETPVARETLTALHDLGVALEIDDFGTGYSSLGYLRRLPVAALKIDRSFVAGLGTDRAGESIVRAVTTLAHGLGIAVTAEGIETEDQLRLLREIGCERGQGYYFAAPMPANECADLLLSRRHLADTVTPAR